MPDIAGEISAPRFVGGAFVVSNFSSLDDSRQLFVVGMILNLGKDGFSQLQHAIQSIQQLDWETAGEEI